MEPATSRAIGAKDGWMYPAAVVLGRVEQAQVDHRLRYVRPSQDIITGHYQARANDDANNLDPPRT